MIVDTHNQAWYYSINKRKERLTMQEYGMNSLYLTPEEREEFDFQRELIEELERENAELKEECDSLITDNEQLNIHIDRLDVEYTELMEENISLEREIDELYNGHYQ